MASIPKAMMDSFTAEIMREARRTADSYDGAMDAARYMGMRVVVNAGLPLGCVIQQDYDRTLVVAPDVMQQMKREVRDGLRAPAEPPEPAPEPVDPSFPRRLDIE
jgi:hypothetical protein